MNGSIESLVLSGRKFSGQEIEEISETVELFRALSRKELARTVCEHLDWVTPAGRYKVASCLKALERLEQRGLFQLPRVRTQHSIPKKAILVGTDKAEPGLIPSTLKELAPIELRIPSTKAERDAWNEHIERYHYLSYKQPFGASLRYFVYSVRQGDLLGCLLFSSSAWAIATRDRWIGWSVKEKQQGLPLIVNNSRYLIFPWVRVKNLASHVLSLAAKQIRADWQVHYCYQPVMLETFVDAQRYRGTCYRAANWLYLGETTGRGRMSSGKKEFLSTPKQVYVQPLVKQWRSFLCGREAGLG